MKKSTCIFLYSVTFILHVLFAFQSFNATTKFLNSDKLPSLYLDIYYDSRFAGNDLVIQKPG